jgi:Icc-related predicted phosphoesterase
MKIQYLSDLHYEFEFLNPKIAKEVDVVVVAGDIMVSDAINEAMSITKILKKTDKPVIFVAGNHEFYGPEPMECVISKIKELEQQYPNFHFLNDEFIDIGEFRFIGSTLWSNLDIVNKIHKMLITSCISDFKHIYMKNSAYINSDYMTELNSKAKMFIKESINTDKRCIVVTHFCPHESCIDKEFKGDLLNQYFACDCEDLMISPVEAWIHGHTHRSVNTFVNDVKVVCNPRGYYNENNKFNAVAVIDL